MQQTLLPQKKKNYLRYSITALGGLLLLFVPGQGWHYDSYSDVGVNNGYQESSDFSHNTYLSGWEQLLFLVLAVAIIVLSVKGFRNPTKSGASWLLRLSFVNIIYTILLIITSFNGSGVTTIDTSYNSIIRPGFSTGGFITTSDGPGMGVFLVLIAALVCLVGGITVRIMARKGFVR